MMQPNSSGSARGRYLVSATESVQLTAFLHEASTDPTLHLLQTIGPHDAPHTAVFEMPHTIAAALAQRFGAVGTLKIEPDRPLSMFDMP